MENEKQSLNNNLSGKTIIFVILLVIVSFSIGVLIGSNFFNKNVNNETNNKETINNDNNDNNNNVVEDNKNNDKEIDVEKVKNKLKSEIYIYTELDPLNKKYSCNNNIVDVSCIEANDLVNIVLNKADIDSLFSNEISDEYEGSTKDYITFDILKKNIKDMFDIDSFNKFPNGEKLGNGYCTTYKMTDSGYERNKSWSGCSFGAHGEIINNKWHMLAITEDNYFVNKDNIYVEVYYYYLTGEDLYNHNENTLYCTDDTKNECVKGSYDNLSKDELTKIRYNFSYEDDILTFESLEIVK